VLEDKTEEYKVQVKVKDFVTITSGPFEGSEGQVQEINTEKGLVRVNINLLGRDTPIEIDFASLRLKK
jgi:transcription termination/antitermination protein NusG